MPEIASLKPYGLSPQTFQPLNPGSYFDRTPIPTPIPDTREASRLAGKAALFGSISKVLSELPEKLISSYNEGRKQKTGLMVRKDYENALAGQQTQSGAVLEDFKATTEGNVSLSPADNETKALQQEYLRKRIDNVGVVKPDKPVVETPFQRNRRILMERGNVTTPPVEESPATTTSPEMVPPVETSISGELPSTDPRKRNTQTVIPSDDPLMRQDTPTSVVVPANITRAEAERNAADTTAAAEAAEAAVREHEANLNAPDPASIRSVITRDAQGRPISVPVNPLSSNGQLGEVQPSPDQIELAAQDIGNQLTNIAPSDLTAANEPGAIQPARSIQPAATPRAAVTQKTAATPEPDGMKYDAETDIITIRKDGRVYHWMEGRAPIDVTPAPAVTKKGGVVFPNVQAIKDAGLDPNGAVMLPDGRLEMLEYKSSGVDAKGRGKLTDTQKTALSSVATLSQSIDGLMNDYDAMDKAGKAGPIEGRLENGLLALGIGSEEGAKIQGQMHTSLFKIARMLNGAGVLTDKDIARAEKVAPTIKMSRGQFKGQLEAVKGTIKDSLEIWLRTNAGQATDEQIALAKEAINSLNGTVPATTAPIQAVPITPTTPAPTPAAAPGSSRQSPIIVKTQEQYNAVPKGAFFRDSAGVKVKN